MLRSWFRGDDPSGRRGNVAQPQRDDKLIGFSESLLRIAICWFVGKIAVFLEVEQMDLMGCEVSQLLQLFQLKTILSVSH